VYDLAFISANKDFTTGGYFDTSDRRIIIDARDLGTWVLDVDHYVIFNNRQYEIKSIIEFENNMGFTVLIRETKGVKITRVEDTISVMCLDHTAVGVV